ncbi:MAG: STAS domain-containing protein [Geitlerinemataceae cyanobacterium]
MSPTIKVVQPTGLLDGSKANQVRRQINECLEAGAQIVLLDLKDVTFIDSSGLGSLVSALKTVRSSGAKMLICSISDQVRILFELTSMDRVFRVYANREEFEQDLKSNSDASHI